jgi:hypothetical protein
VATEPSQTQHAGKKEVPSLGGQHVGFPNVADRRLFHPSGSPPYRGRGRRRSHPWVGKMSVSRMLLTAGFSIRPALPIPGAEEAPLSDQHPLWRMRVSLKGEDHMPSSDPRGRECTKHLSPPKVEGILHRERVSYSPYHHANITKLHRMHFTSTYTHACIASLHAIPYIMYMMYCGLTV